MWLQLWLVLPKPGGGGEAEPVRPGLSCRITDTRSGVTQRDSG